MNWVGIGAQRSGSTWFTDVLCQHPAMTLSGKKELHYFDRFLYDEFTPEDAEQYPAQEFTPGYLRWPWVPRLLRRACPDALLVVILRDPTERFFSAMRWHKEREERTGQKASRDRNLEPVDAAWGGMYARQLKLWADVFPREQIHVEQYERAVANPQAAAELVWAKLGLEPVPLGDVSAPSRTATDQVNTWHQQKHDLSVLYEPEVKALARWGIDAKYWPSFGPHGA